MVALGYVNTWEHKLRVCSSAVFIGLPPSLSLTDIHPSRPHMSPCTGLGSIGIVHHVLGPQNSVGRRSTRANSNFGGTNILPITFGKGNRNFIFVNGRQVIYTGSICNVFKCWKCKGQNFLKCQLIFKFCKNIRSLMKIRVYMKYEKTKWGKSNLQSLSLTCISG